eukprot:3066664-Rhodomonas_salina.1
MHYHVSSIDSRTLITFESCRGDTDNEKAGRKLLVGTHTSESEQNYLMVVKVVMPTEEDVELAKEEDGKHRCLQLICIFAAQQLHPLFSSRGMSCNTCSHPRRRGDKGKALSRENPEANQPRRRSQPVPPPPPLHPTLFLLFPSHLFASSIPLLASSYFLLLDPTSAPVPGTISAQHSTAHTQPNLSLSRLHVTSHVAAHTTDARRVRQSAVYAAAPQDCGDQGAVR